MMRTLLSRTVYEKRWFIAGWGLVFAVMSGLVLLFYPSFGKNGGFDQVATTLPEQLKGFIGDPSVFRTIEGFITSQIYDVRLSLMAMIMTLVLAISLTLRDEDNGDMRTLLALKLSRTRLVLEKCGAAVVIILLINLATTAGVYIGLVALGETMPHGLIWQLFLLATLFAVASFVVPYGVALASGKRGLTMFVGLLLAIGSYILTTFAKSVDWLKNWDYASLMHYYRPDTLRVGDFGWLDVWVLGAVIVIMLLVAILLFRRRDIA